ncbi:MAG: phosphoglucomutase [Deltaproteobacteria bacterium]|nr:phosphoglucomutase [Deltaproteobacteria bacterium]
MMRCEDMSREIRDKYIIPGNHAGSNYFAAISELVRLRDTDPANRVFYQKEINGVYLLVRDEILTSQARPISPVKFGTSGWRGVIGKDVTVKSVSQVTQAIVDMYKDLDNGSVLGSSLGVRSYKEARERGCALGYDNRFGGEIFAQAVAEVLTAHGFRIYFAGESTTGVLSAAVMELAAAFSCNLTPSHNPLEYGGFKFNAADAGPAAPEITRFIQEKAQKIIEGDLPVKKGVDSSLISPFNALDVWKGLIRKNKAIHHIDYDAVIEEFGRRDDVVVAVDCVHGASRIHIKDLLGDASAGRLIIIRGEDDPTFGGVAPEPSSKNMVLVNEALRARKERLRLGVIIDPDADRIRFTDGQVEIEMNQFGPLAYHYLHEVEGIKGLVAKTVATSNFANAIAAQLGEEVFEPKVGFKEFKPVIDRAVVCFEESDGITIKGHTPEKDAYIGLILALAMTLHLNQNLGRYLAEVQGKFGHFYAARDAVPVSQQGEELSTTLKALSRYTPGTKLKIGADEKVISQLINIDGYKMVFGDGSWLLIRPSGTEPKVRFYVEARTEEGKEDLFATARGLLREIGLL